MAPLLLLYSLKRQKCFPLSCAVGRFGRFGKVSGLSKTLHTEASLPLQNAFLKNQETGILVPSISSKESWNFCFKHPFLPCDLAGAIFRVLGLWVAFWVYSERAVPSEGTEAGPSLQNHVPSTRLIHSANLFSALSKQRHCGMWSFSREKKKTVLPLASGNLHRGSQAAGPPVLIYHSSSVESLVSCSPGSLQNSNMSFPNHPILVP